MNLSEKPAPNRRGRSDNERSRTKEFAYELDCREQIAGRVHPLAKQGPLPHPTVSNHSCKSAVIFFRRLPT